MDRKTRPKNEWIIIANQFAIYARMKTAMDSNVDAFEIYDTSFAVTNFLIDHFSEFSDSCLRLLTIDQSPWSNTKVSSGLLLKQHLTTIVLDFFDANPEVNLIALIYFIFHILAFIL